MTKNNTKTATFKTFEAARLTAGKYAGMCINKSEEREHDGKFFTYYSSSARNVSRDWYALKASEIAAMGYDCLGFWDIPAGLKAASLMVCRLSNYSRNFRFSLDRSGAWMFHYDDPDGFEYSNGSAEDVKGDRVEMDDDQNARDFVWALSRFERVQLWENNGKIFMAVGSIDDGRLLLLNAGVNARFVSSDDDVWTVDPAAEVVAAVANYPAAPVAACEAPKAENGKETKKRLYWPVRNGAGTAAAEEANRTEAKMRVIGPVSMAGLEYVRAELASVCDYDRSEEWVGKYTVELSLALARMEEENPALFKATRKAPEENGTGLKIAKNGLYVRESGKWELYRAFYSVDNRCDGRPCVTVYARSYGDLPKGFGLEIENDSDPYTDYVTGDRATVYEDHPLYKKFREAAAGAKHYHLTAEDVESVREYVENKIEAARMEREAEDAARAAKEEEKERHAREVIAEYVELFPGDAYHPHVIVEWSELGAMDDHGRTRGDATIFSVEAFEAITGDLDKYFEGDLGYNKLKFTFYAGNGSEFTDRCDLGDGGGSYGKRMRYALGHARERASNGDIMLDGGAVVGLDEYEANARKYLENLAVTWDEIGAA